MLNYSWFEDVNPTKTRSEDSPIMRLLVPTLFILGIFGSIFALIHLFRKQKLPNAKQVFMLKCLVIFDLVGLMGLITQKFIKYYIMTDDFYQDHIEIFCFTRLLWRNFGYCSGCVAFVMGIERYFALTKPFFYCKHFTNNLLKWLITILCSFSTFSNFAPVFGIGIYHHDNFYAKNCRCYRESGKSSHMSYALVSYFTGTLFCLLMVLCNYSVTQIVQRSYRNMEKLTMNCVNNGGNMINRSQESIRTLYSVKAINKRSTSSKSISILTRDEIKFIKLCNMLTASFVICWETQVTIIPIAQFMKNPNQSNTVQIFYQIADFLLLTHFAMDPYIYVLLRTNYWKRFKKFMSQLLFKNDNKFDDFPKMDQ